jgi:hypothetical protein
MADPIRINGNLYSWGSIIAKVGPTPITGFTAINYGDSRERVKGYGMGRHHAPLSRSRGRYEVENPTLTGFKHAVQHLRDALAKLAPVPGGYGDTPFDLSIQATELGLPPLIVVIERCLIVGDSSSNEEGTDPLTEELTLDAMLIKRNGLVLFDASRGRP